VVQELRQADFGHLTRSGACPPRRRRGDCPQGGRRGPHVRSRHRTPRVRHRSPLRDRSPSRWRLDLASL